MILLICRSFARDHDHAQDLAQETWVTVCRKIRTFEASGTFRAWLGTVAKSVCLNDARAHERATNRNHLYERRRVTMVDRAKKIDPLVDDERREIQQHIYRMLTQLPDQARRAVTLRIMEERSTAEVARMMSITPATVRSHVRHAVARLRQLMEHSDEALSRYRSSS